MRALTLGLVLCMVAQAVADDRDADVPQPKIVGRKKDTSQEDKAAAERLQELAPRTRTAPPRNATPDRSRENTSNNRRAAPARSELPGENRLGEELRDRGSAADLSLSPVHLGTQKMRPPELMAEALANIKEGQLKGKGLSLTAALAQSGDRQQQLKITQAYWNLAAAQANYHFKLEHETRLRRMTRGEKWEALARGDKWEALATSARASAAAGVNDAELAVLDAQQKLAQQLGRSTTDDLPLAIDQPHVGQYRTYFDDLFVGRTAPPRMQLIDRMVPTWRLSIDVHAEAILAGLDAVEATADDLRHGDADLNAYLRALDDLDRERRLFVASARDYNRGIAEYALAVASPGESETKLVAMLIKNPAVDPAAPARSGAAAERTATPTGRPVETTAPGETPPDDPTPAGRARTFRDADPRDAAPRDVSPRDPRDGNRRDAAPRDAAPAGRSPDETRRNADPYGRDLFDQNGNADRGRQVDRKIEADRRGEAAPEGAALGDGGIYQGLTDTTPQLRAQKLAGLLHWDRSPLAESGQGLSLRQCLEKVAPNGRRAVIAAYWKARQRAASYQLLSEQVDQLNMLSTTAVELGTQKGSPTGMLRLRAAKQAVRAAMLDERIALLHAQYDLAELLHWNLQEAWPLPNTPPHAGGYRLALEALSKSAADSATIKRLAAAVPVLGAELGDRATAIVFADVARARTTYQGPHSLEAALTATRRQTQETLRFLRTLTDYNLAIADYALAISSPDVPAPQLIELLVTAREEKSST